MEFCSERMECNSERVECSTERVGSDSETVDCSSEGEVTFRESGRGTKKWVIIAQRE